MAELIQNISNDDIRWDANFAGLAPTVTGDAATHLPEIGENAVAELLIALSDPEKFVSAHVLLTQMTGMEHEVFPTWNGLTVDIQADGTVDIPSGQRSVLANRWRKWHQISPRPRKLPEAD